MGKMESPVRTVKLSERDVPVFGEYEVVVAGGGPAGFCAGLSAARSGAETLIVEQFNCLGGMVTTGLHQHVGMFMGEGGEKPIVGGLPEEIARRAACEWGADFSGYMLDVEIEGFKCLLDDMAAESGLDVLFYTQVGEPLVDNGDIQCLLVHNKSGLGAIGAERFVDCTGDADVAAGAGCPVMHGREEDNRTQPSTLMFRVGGVDVAAVERAQADDWNMRDYVRKANEQGLLSGWQSRVMGFWRVSSRPDQMGVNFTHLHLDATSPEELSRAAVMGRRQVQETVEAFREIFPGFEDAYLMDTAVQMGVRETRRIRGQYILTAEDVKEQKIFADSIGLGSAFVDIHNVDGPGMDEKSGFHLPKGGYYSIPYRTLIPREVRNLLVAGRCHSCTHTAAGSTRWIAQCMVMGEAAGTAAALSLDAENSPGDLDAERVREVLQQRGAILE